MKLIKGNEVSDSIRNNLRLDINKLKNEHNVTPGLAVVIVGDNPASKAYVRMKEKACKNMGIYSEIHRLNSDISETELLNLISEINNNKSIHGILVQLPLPKHINEKKVIESIDIEKDVDGFHPINIGNLVIGEDSFIPCTPHGIIKLLEYENIEIEGKHAVIIGRSNIVGKPMGLLLLHRNATVTICHSRTKNLKELTSKADILIVAVGKPEFIDEDYIKPDTVVIDVGINRIDGKLVGDVDFESITKKAGHITPVPGGVGPMTITMLIYNTVRSAFKSIEK